MAIHPSIRSAFFVVVGIAGCKHSEKSQSGSSAPADSMHAAASPRGAPSPPPPLRVKNEAPPPLPDLPPLEKQDRVVPAKASSREAEYPCGEVDVDGQKIPLVCEEEQLDGALEAAAVPLVTYATLRPKDAKLPQIVDHRSEGTEGVTRNQGRAPSCSAFAIAGAIDHAAARFTGTPVQVSTMQLWARYHKASGIAALRANLEHPLGDEGSWPYAWSDAVSWMDPAYCKKKSRPESECGKTPDPTRVAAAARTPVAEFAQAESLHPAADIEALKAKLAAGQDVVIGLSLGGDFGKPHKAGGVSYVPDYGEKKGGHYVLLTGYAALAHGTYFLVKNSWGDHWGDGGFAWIHESTLGKHMTQAFIVDARPVGAAARRKVRERKAASCSGELVRDSITGACAGKCPDGSPRHDNVCAVSGQCPAGYVNLTGSCVMAAPKASGTDPSSSIRFDCGPGGCAYWVPKTARGCNEATCMVSCPAPDFRVGYDPSGLTCME